MSSRSPLPCPALLYHARTQQYYVWLGKAAGGRRYMGRDPELARKRYGQFKKEWDVTHAPPPRVRPGAATVGEVLVAYYRHRQREGVGRSDLGRLKRACWFAKKYHRADPAASFRGPVLKALRRRMLVAPCRRHRKGEAPAPLSRRYVNRLVNDLKACWRWAASEDLVPTEVADNLSMVATVRKHKGGRELPRVTDVEPWAVEATLPELHRVAADMVRLQQLAGMRPKELCLLRRRDVSTCPAERVPLPESRKHLAAVDVDGARVWLAVPESHKTLWRGPRPRAIALGPRAQAVLRPYVEGRPPDAYLFSPLAAVNEWRLAHDRLPVHAAARTPGEHYTTQSYGRAVKAAVARANRKREKADPPVEPVPHWMPNQLRHAAATAAAERFDRATASAMLGNGMDVIDRYVEQELQKAARAAAAIG